MDSAMIKCLSGIFQTQVQFVALQKPTDSGHSLHINLVTYYVTFIFCLIHLRLTLGLNLPVSTIQVMGLEVSAITLSFMFTFLLFF